jgi:hypothetical protein
MRKNMLFLRWPMSLSVYRSPAGARPTRTVATVRNPYRFQSKLRDAFTAVLREQRPEPDRT